MNKEGVWLITLVGIAILFFYASIFSSEQIIKQQPSIKSPQIIPDPNSLPDPYSPTEFQCDQTINYPLVEGYSGENGEPDLFDFFQDYEVDLELLCDSTGSCANCINEPKSPPTPEGENYVFLCQEHEGLGGLFGHAKILIKNCNLNVDEPPAPGNVNVIIIEDGGYPHSSIPGLCTGKGKPKVWDHDLYDDPSTNPDCEPLILPEDIDQCTYAEQLLGIALEADNYFWHWNLCKANCGGYTKFLAECLSGQLPFLPNLGIGCGWNTPVWEKIPDPDSPDGYNKGNQLTPNELCDELRESIGLPPFFESLPCESGQCCTCEHNGEQCLQCKDGGGIFGGGQQGSKAILTVNYYREIITCSDDAETCPISCELVNTNTKDLQQKEGCFNWGTSSAPSGPGGFQTSYDDSQQEFQQLQLASTASAALHCGLGWSWTMQGFNTPEDELVDPNPVFVNEDGDITQPCQIPTNCPEVEIPEPTNTCTSYEIYQKCGTEAVQVVKIEAQSKNTDTCTDFITE
jgi:hypothetical protein